MTNAAVLCSGKQQKTEPGVGRLVMVSAQDGSLPSLITPPQLTISERFKHPERWSVLSELKILKYKLIFKVGAKNRWQYFAILRMCSCVFCNCRDGAGMIRWRVPIISRPGPRSQAEQSLLLTVEPPRVILQHVKRLQNTADPPLRCRYK